VPLSKFVPLPALFTSAHIYPEENGEVVIIVTQDINAIRAVNCHPSRSRLPGYSGSPPNSVKLFLLQPFAAPLAFTLVIP
jgi:hypothetical protein